MSRLVKIKKGLKNKSILLGSVLLLLTVGIVFLSNSFSNSNNKELLGINYNAILADRDTTTVKLFELQNSTLRSIFSNSNGITLSNGTRHTRAMYYGFLADREFYVYCIELGNLATTGDRYVYNTSTFWQNLNSTKKEGIELSTVFGFPNKIRTGYSNELQYIVTQSIIWEFQQGWRVNYNEIPSNRIIYDNFIIKNAGLKEVYNSIIKDMREYSKVPSFANRSEASASNLILTFDSSTSKYKRVFTDKNTIISGLDVNCPSGLTCQKGQNNTLTITANKPGTYTIKLSKFIPSNLKQAKLIIDNGSSQRMLLGKASINSSVSYLKVSTETLGSIKIKKTSEDGVKKGFTFKITGPNNFSKNVTTDDNGEALLSNLVLGNYTITETNVPSRYQAVSSQTVKLNTSNLNVTQTFNNILVNNSVVKVAKLDSETKDFLSGAEIQIKQGDKVIESWTSSATLYILKNKLDIDKTYKICEIRTPSGYVPLNKCYEFKLTSKDQTLNLVLENDPSSMNINKIDENNQPLKGAHLQIIDSKGKVIHEWISDGTKHEIKKLIDGEKYILRETKAPEGYVKSKDVTFIAKNNNEVKMTNEKTKVIISKQDVTTGKEIAGAHLELLDSNNSKIEEWISKDGKSHEVLGLIVGQKYTLKETIAPEGYSISNSISFVVGDTNPTKVVMKDELTKVVISKQDVTTGKEIAGAHLQIIDENKQIKAEWISEEGKNKTIEGLINGHSYILRETIAPYGYAITEDVVFVVGDKAKVVMKNEMTEVIVEKRDVVSNGIVEGAHLQLLNSDGEVIDEWDSSNEAYVIVGLPTGEKFTIRETKSPKDYLISDDIVFTLSADEKSKTVVVYNTPIIDVPDTASNISILSVSAGVFLILSGIMVILWMKKRNA